MLAIGKWCFMDQWELPGETMHEEMLSQAYADEYDLAADVLRTGGPLDAPDEIPYGGIHGSLGSLLVERGKNVVHSFGPAKAHAPLGWEYV